MVVGGQRVVIVWRGHCVLVSVLVGLTDVILICFLMLLLARDGMSVLFNCSRKSIDDAACVRGVEWVKSCCVGSLLVVRCIPASRLLAAFALELS